MGENSRLLATLAAYQGFFSGFCDLSIVCYKKIYYGLMQLLTIVTVILDLLKYITFV